MADKLQIEHIAPYYPFKVRFRPNILQSRDYIINTLDRFIGSDDYLVNGYAVDQIVLKLRPLSDLNKEIGVNSEKFIPINKLAEIEAGYRFKEIKGCPFIVDDNICVNYKDRFGINTIGVNFKKLDIGCERGLHNDSCRNLMLLINELYKCHFDLFGLIDKGLAEPI